MGPPPGYRDLAAIRPDKSRGASPPPTCLRPCAATGQASLPIPAPPRYEWTIGCGRSSEVERQLPKLNVVGSFPIARSIFELLSRSFFSSWGPTRTGGTPVAHSCQQHNRWFGKPVRTSRCNHSVAVSTADHTDRLRSLDTPSHTAVSAPNLRVGTTGGPLIVFVERRWARQRWGRCQMQVIERHVRSGGHAVNEHQARVALAAALHAGALRWR